MIRIYSEDPSKNTLTIDSDNRTVHTNFNTSNDRVNLVVNYRIPKTSKFIFEDNMTSITKEYWCERIDWYFVKRKHSVFSNIHSALNFRSSSFVRTGETNQFSDSISLRDNNNLSIITNTLTVGSKSNSPGVRAYGFDFPNKIIYFFRDGVQVYAQNLSSYPEVVAGINNMDFALIARVTFENNILVNKFNFGESGFTYSYPGFTPLAQIQEFDLDWHPSNCFIY